MKKPGREGFGSDCWIGGPEEVAPQTLLEKNSHAGDLYEQLSVQSQWGRRCRRVLCLRADMSAMLQVMWNRFQHFLDLQSIKMYKPVSSFPLMHFPPPSRRDDASAKATLFQHLVEDRSEWASSYHEFLQHIQQQVSK